MRTEIVCKHCNRLVTRTAGRWRHAEDNMLSCLSARNEPTGELVLWWPAGQRTTAEPVG